MDASDAWLRIERNVLVSRPERGQEVQVSIGRASIEERAAWSVRQDHHTVFVHLSGALQEVVAVLERGPTIQALPSVGSIWVVPAGLGFDGLLWGGSTQFCEICLPTLFPKERELELEPLIEGRDDLLYQIALLFKQHTEAKDDPSKMSCASLIEVARWHIIQRYGRVVPLRKNKDHAPRKFAASERLRIDSFIRDNLAERLSLQQLAEIAKMSTHTLLKSFAASFGTTPTQYIIQTRVNRAKSMLRSTPHQITDIALATGFYSSSHFSASFTKHVGVAPAAYRTSCEIRDRD